MAIITQPNLSQWDYGQRNADFATWGDVMRNYGNQGRNQGGYFGGGSTGGGNRSNPTGAFWTERLAKDPALDAAYRNTLGYLPGNTTANMTGVDNFARAMGNVTRQSSQLTNQQLRAANAPFDGTLANQLGTARKSWAQSATEDLGRTNDTLTNALNEWNTGQTGRIGSLEDQLSQQLGQSLGRMGEQVESAYNQELAANQQYGTLRDRMSRLNQNRALSQVLASTAPGMGSSMSGINNRVALRMANDQAAEDALLMNQMNRESLGRKLAGEMGLLETGANLGRSDIQSIGGMGMSQADNYYRQLAAIQGSDAARRQYITDQITGQGGLQDIGYVAGQQSQWFGRPQALLASDANQYLMPVQARQAALGGEFDLIGRGGQALNAANFVSVGTNQNMGGQPRYAAPPMLQPMGSPVPQWYPQDIGYMPQAQPRQSSNEDAYFRMIEQGYDPAAGMWSQPYNPYQGLGTVQPTGGEFGTGE